MKDKNEQEKKFKVTDRRLITENEEAASDAASQTTGQAPHSPGPAETEATPTPSAQVDATVGAPETEPPGDYTEMDFSSLVMSFASTALVQMGDAPQPGGGQAMVDMGAAKQTINILLILKEKTKGNLEPKEKELIDSLVAELQMRFVQKSG